MKKLFFVFSMIALLTLSSVSGAAWKLTYVVRAESPSAYGVGTSVVSEGHARRIALQECAIRTPAYESCGVVMVNRRWVWW